MLQFPFLQLPDKTWVGVDLCNKTSYFIAILEHMFVCLIVVHFLMFDEIGENKSNRARDSSHAMD